jgi:hypothetical protein
VIFVSLENGGSKLGQCRVHAFTLGDSRIMSRNEISTKET